MAWFLRDRPSGLWWNNQSYRHNGTWLTHRAFAPVFSSEEAAMAHAKQVGMMLERVTAVQDQTWPATEKAVR